ncbi:cupredoxin domain-containing protein [Shigella flexneri]
MTINFRRNALQLSVAALFSSAFMANAADVPQVKVTVTDKQCEPMTITVNAGNTVHYSEPQPEGAGVGDPRRRDGGGRAGVRPGFSQKMTANLQPGESPYDLRSAD